LRWETNAGIGKTLQNAAKKGVKLTYEPEIDSNLELYPYKEVHLQLSPYGNVNAFLPSVFFANDAVDWLCRNLIPSEGRLKLRFKGFQVMLNSRALQRFKPSTTTIELQAARLLAYILQVVDNVEGDKRLLHTLRSELLACLLMSSTFGLSLIMSIGRVPPTKEAVKALRKVAEGIKSSSALELRLWDSVKKSIEKQVFKSWLSFARSLDESEKTYSYEILCRILLCGLTYAFEK
jgi:hypothetical protein